MKSDTTTTDVPATVKTRRELADAFGLKDEARISRYVAAGMPVNSDSSYCVADCSAWRDVNIRPKDNESKFAKWRWRHEREKTKIARINRRKMENASLDIHEAYHLMRPMIIAVGELAAELMEHLKIDPTETKLTKAVLSVVDSMEPIQQKIGDKVSAASIDKPNPNRFLVIADRLGIEIPTL